MKDYQKSRYKIQKSNQGEFSLCQDGLSFNRISLIPAGQADQSTA